MRILINRNGAYGDIIHMSHLPRLFKNHGCTFLGVSTGFRGLQLLKHNPFIDTIHYFEPGGRTITQEHYDGRLSVLSELYDRTINLICSLEQGALALENQREYYQHINIRKRIGERNYYDIATELAGYPHLTGKYRGEVFYTEEEVSMVEHDLLRDGRFRDNFRVMINLSGSGPHKVFIQAPEIAERILSEYPDSIIFTTGAESVKELDFPDISGRIRSIVGKKPFRQALLMAKYMHCVIGCESGMMCGANMWDVPTVHLLTATSRLAHCKYAENDYSIQSPAYCSPCYKGPYKYYGCPKKDGLPLCVYFNPDDIMIRIKEIYEGPYRRERPLPACS